MTGSRDGATHSRSLSQCTVLITGGTGALGGAIARRLAHEGHPTRILARNAGPDPGAPELQPFAGDVRDPAALAPALAGVDVVVHAAGILREDPHENQTFDGVYRHGTRTLVEAMATAGVTRLIHVSGTGADPESPDPLSRAKGLAEREAATDALDWTILRPSVVFGLRGGMMDRIAWSVRVTPPVVVLPGRGRGLFQPVWRDDVTACVLETIRRDETVRATYELGGPDTWSYRDLVTTAMAHLGVRRRIVPIPPRLLLAGAAFPRLIGKDALITRTELYQLLRNNRTDPTVLPRIFGITPASLHDHLGDVFRRKA